MTISMLPLIMQISKWGGAVYSLDSTSIITTANLTNNSATVSFMIIPL